MTSTSSSLNRRRLLGTTAAVAASSLIPANVSAATEDTTIRPFRINVPEEELVDLRRRVAATRWPDRETVTDDSQGVPLATMQELARYWATDYDWRKVEAKLNALPQFIDRDRRAWTFTSSTFVQNMKMPCRSSSRTAGPARSSSSSRLSIH